MAEYDIGDVVRLYGSFTDPNASDAALDPTAVLLTIKEPRGKITTYTYGVGATIVKSATGNYYADFTPTYGGRHYYRWYSTGTGQAAEEDNFDVKAPKAR